MVKTDEQIAIDRICEASGYQRWWISSGRLHFERDKAPDRIEVLPIISVAHPTRNAIIEECAKVCDNESMDSAEQLARRIRALKQSSPLPQPERE